MVPATEQSGRVDSPDVDSPDVDSPDLAGMLFINGKERPLPHPASVRGALEALGLANRPVAVELNGRLVRRGEQAKTAVEPGDRIEIVTFVGGG